jgi:nitrogen fixation negative regulator NifL
MNLAALLIPPSLDERQALRLRRFGLAALTYALATALVAVAWTFGLLPASAALAVVAAFLAINLGLYVVMRSGFNLRFEDPSLTRFQILAAITAVMYTIYHMDDGRNVVLFACFIVFLFGVFRLNAREFAVLAIYTLAAYALVINLLMQFRPQAIHSVPGELMSWLGLAVFLPYFTIIGGHINTLRRNLRESERRESERREGEMRFRSLTEMSSDFYWESDVEHRMTMRGSAIKAGKVSMFQRRAEVGERRWEVPYLSPDEAGWQAHRAVLDAHRPFRDFEFSRLGLDGTERHISISGDSMFDESGAFKGYRGVGTDITARKRAERALRESEMQLKGILESTADGILAVDGKGKVIRTNRQFAELWRIPKSLLDSGDDHALLDFVLSQLNDTEAFLQKVRELYASTAEVTDMLTFKDGRIFERHSSPLIFEGAILGRVWSFRDITERKRMEERLQKLFNAVEHSPAATVITDIRGGFEYVNPKFLEVTGYTREELIGKTTALTQSGLTLPDVYEELWRTILSGRQWRGEMQNRKKNGELYWEYQIISSIENGRGEIVNFIAVKEDITERKRAEGALRESERRFSHLLGNVELISLMRDREGRITYCNEYLLRLTGWRHEDVIGRNWFELFIPSEAAEEKRAIFAALIANRPEAWHHESEILTRSGERRLIHWNNSVLRSGVGDVIGTAGIGQDVTEQKRAAEALRQEHASLLKTQQELLDAHESLAEADRLESVGRLAAGVAHEVKNPLTIIRLGIDYLAKQFSQEGNQEVLDDVRRAIDRAEHVIRDLLDFSRQKPFARRPTDIDEVIDSAIHLIHHEIKRRNIAIIRNRDDSMPPIYADPDRLVQVFINLLSNAAQAIGQDGSIEIVTRSICLSESDLERAETGILKIGDPVVSVDIRDNGTGIWAEHQNKLFEPFFTTKPVGEGTGLGLAVSRNIVIMHGGSISISNRPAGGASALLMFRVDSEYSANEKADTGSR